MKPKNALDRQINLHNTLTEVANMINANQRPSSLTYAARKILAKVRRVLDENKPKETRVYQVSSEISAETSIEEIISQAETEGTVYSLEGFAKSLGSNILIF